MRQRNNEFDLDDYLANDDAYNVVDRHPRGASPVKIICLVIVIYFIYQFLSSSSFSIHTVVDKVEPGQKAVSQSEPGKVPEQASLHRAIRQGKLDSLPGLLQGSGAEAILKAISTLVNWFLSSLTERPQR